MTTETEPEVEHKRQDCVTVMMRTGATIGVGGPSQAEVWNTLFALAEKAKDMALPLIPVQVVNFRTGDLTTAYIDYNDIEMIGEVVDWDRVEESMARREQGEGSTPSLEDVLRKGGINVR